MIVLILLAYGELPKAASDSQTCSLKFGVLRRPIDNLCNSLHFFIELMQYNMSPLGPQTGRKAQKGTNEQDHVRGRKIVQLMSMSVFN